MSAYEKRCFAAGSRKRWRGNQRGRQRGEKAQEEPEAREYANQENDEPLVLVFFFRAAARERQAEADI